MATDRETQLLKAAYEAGIASPKELANFMAQVSAESNGLNQLDEGFRYTKGPDAVVASVQSAKRKGPEALNVAWQEAMDGQPEKLAELMYGGRMGNNEPGDGYKYHGRGYIQLTGKNQYREAGEALNLDLIDNPELAARPENAARIAVWFWKENVQALASQSVREAGSIINTGELGNTPNGLKHREAEFAKWERRLTPELMQNLAMGRLGEAAEHQPSASATTRSDFQRTMERMLPGQGGTDPHITGHYGEARGNHRPHGGTDFNYEGGQTGRNLQHPTVHAPIGGVVTVSGGDFGTVKIRDAQGNSHEILHLDSRSVKEGQTVHAGDPIGTMGGRGPNGANQYAQHVHYQIHDAKGQLVSPESWWNQGRQVETGGHAPHAAGTLRHGDRSEDVRGLQQQLNQLGIRDGHGKPLSVDGHYGDNTRDAVMSLQKEQGLKQDGVLGPQTRKALQEQTQHRDQPAPQTQTQRGPSPNDAGHPYKPLEDAIKTQQPSLSNDAAAHVTAQAVRAGIDSPDKLRGVTMQDNTAHVLGTVPGFRASVDLNQPVPSAQESASQLLAARNTETQQQDQQRQVAVGGR